MASRTRTGLALVTNSIGISYYQYWYLIEIALRVCLGYLSECSNKSPKHKQM